MTLTLAGRLQTRLVLLTAVGVPWTLVIALPLAWATGMPLRLTYRVTLETAIALVVLGVVWEFIYHGIQQLRWDKDWPAVFGLMTVINEGTVVWLVLHALKLIPEKLGISSPMLPLFATYVGATWLLLWLVMQGPLRFVAPRWRFEGGKFTRRAAPNLVVPFVMINIGTILALVALWAVWS